MKTLFRIVGLIFVVAILYVGADHIFPRPMAHAALSVQHWLGGVELKTLQIPGFEIAYLDGGSGEPLVMVHGIGADKDNWAQIAPFLRGTGRLIALDLPGLDRKSTRLNSSH